MSELLDTKRKFLTRKELASMLVDCSTDQIRKNEKAWGLDKARCDLNKRVVRYKRLVVIGLFQQKGWI